MLCVLSFVFTLKSDITLGILITDSSCYKLAQFTPCIFLLQNVVSLPVISWLSSSRLSHPYSVCSSHSFFTVLFHIFTLKCWIFVGDSAVVFTPKSAEHRSLSSHVRPTARLLQLFKFTPLNEKASFYILMFRKRKEMTSHSKGIIRDNLGSVQNKE